MSRGWWQRTSDPRALFLASALHGVALIAVWDWATHHALARARAPWAGLSRAATDAVEVELDWPSPGDLPQPVGDRRVLPAQPLSQPVQDTAPHRFGLPTRLPGPSATEVERVASADSSAPTSPQDATEHTRAIDLGLGPDAYLRWLSESKSNEPSGERVRPASRPLFHLPPISTSGGLQEGLEAHDRSLGIGPSGAVVSALYHAAHTDEASAEGVARFRVTVLESGAVEVALSDASGDFDGWRAVAASAEAALRRAPPHIPSCRKAALVVVEITAKQTFPNGLEPKQLHGLRPQAEPLRLRSVQEAQRELTDRNPVLAERAAPGQVASGSKANVNLPGVYVGARGKVCSYRLGLTPLLALFEDGCDLSNLGAKPQRLVSTRVREETLY